MPSPIPSFPLFNVQHIEKLGIGLGTRLRAVYIIIWYRYVRTYAYRPGRVQAHPAQSSYSALLTPAPGTMEDAVTFLESAKKVYSDVTLILNKLQLLALDKDPNEPFSDQVWSVRISGGEDKFFWLRSETKVFHTHEVLSRG